MPDVTGSVFSINMSPMYCCLQIDRSEGGREIVLLWSYDSQPDNATNRLLHANYLALARDAYIHNKTLGVTREQGSALATGVWVEQ